MVPPQLNKWTIQTGGLCSDKKYKKNKDPQLYFEETQMSHVVMSHFTPGFIGTHTIKQY